MEENKKNLLMEQANKIAEVVRALTENFGETDVTDEVNYLNIVKSNLQDWVAKS